MSTLTYADHFELLHLFWKRVQRGELDVDGQRVRVRLLTRRSHVIDAETVRHSWHTRRIDEGLLRKKINAEGWIIPDFLRKLC